MPLPPLTSVFCMTARAGTGVEPHAASHFHLSQWLCLPCTVLVGVEGDAGEVGAAPLPIKARHHAAAGLTDLPIAAGVAAAACARGDHACQQSIKTPVMHRQPSFNSLIHTRARQL